MSDREPAETHRDDAAQRGPRDAYARRLEARRVSAGRLERRSRLLSNLRLLVFAAGVLAAGLALAPPHRLPLAWLWPIALGFVALVIAHDRALQAKRRAERAAAFYERGLARLDDRWAGGGEGGEGCADAHHPYAADLDVFGSGSLYELLCSARTRAGQRTLADWLCEAAAPDEVRARQAAVDELRPRLDLREDLDLLGADVRAGLHPERLGAWGAEPAEPASLAARAGACALAVLAVLSLCIWVLEIAGGGVPAASFLPAAGPLPLLVVGAAELVLAWRYRARVVRIAHGVETPLRELELLVGLLARVEAERFETPRLRALRAALDTEGLPPSRRVASLRRSAAFLEARRNQLFALPSVLLLWTTQFALAIEAWRAVSGPALGRWIAAVGELEALCALAAYAFEHPADPFPEIAEDGQPRIDAVGLGHPLIPESRCIRNDVSIGGELRLLIVSGSNMSGKSTLLRTIGTNVVLAQAGAPVRARRLRLSPVAVGASIRIQDSLQEGHSRFYAEIQRLRQIVDLAETGRPLLFLLDEILHGTNSHDRRIGAEAVVRGLVERGAIGLVTTHDLALARIAEEQAARARNVHFADHLEDGRMRFDYRLHEGVVAKSNALELMRAVGLRV